MNWNIDKMQILEEKGDKRKEREGNKTEKSEEL